MGFQCIATLFVVLIALAARCGVLRVDDLQRAFKAAEKSRGLSRQIDHHLMQVIGWCNRANQYRCLRTVRFAAPDVMWHETAWIESPEQAVQLFCLLFIFNMQIGGTFAAQHFVCQATGKVQRILVRS